MLKYLYIHFHFIHISFMIIFYYFLIVVYSFFYVNVLSLITLNHLISITNMTFYIYYLTFSPTFFASIKNKICKIKLQILNNKVLSLLYLNLIICGIKNKITLLELIIQIQSQPITF